MKKTILTILIVGMWGTVDGQYDPSVHPGHILDLDRNKDGKVSVDEHNYYLNGDMSPSCTVFVPVPCTVWASTVIPDAGEQLYEDMNLYNQIVQPLTIDYGDSVWVNPRYTRLVDSLSILSKRYKWQRIDAIVDSVLAEM